MNLFLSNLKNSFGATFFFLLGFSLLLSISVNSLIWVWMTMEINFMMFLPITLIFCDLKMLEQSMKFFIIQSFSSILILLSIILMKDKMFKSLFNMLFIFFLFNKMGISPLHFWALKYVENLKWFTFFLFITVQKIIPIVFMLMIFIMEQKKMLFFFILQNSFFGSMFGMNQFSLRKILFYSSLNHFSWILMCFFISMKILKIYYLIYLSFTYFLCYIMEIFKVDWINQLFFVQNSKFLQMNKMVMSKILLFFCSLPPTIGLLPKMIIILKMETLWIIYTMVVMNMFSVFFYMRFMMVFLLNLKFYPKIIKKYKNSLYNLYKTFFMNFLNYIILIFLFIKMF